MNPKNNKFLPFTPDLSTKLYISGSKKKINHLFEKEHIEVINTAIACNRPLLLTGEPGIGKTQLARAAAKALGRAFVRHTVDAKTESRDLLYHFDAVARLADAQLLRSHEQNNQQDKDKDKNSCEIVETKYKQHCKDKLPVADYICPGPLWWGLNWAKAIDQQLAEEPVQHDGGDFKKGVVVLIDEIDKAEIGVPNGLLEALGESSFHPRGLPEPVRTDEGITPFIVITTNRERGLPDAFIRRCAVIRMELPKDEDKLLALLIKRGKAHSKLPEKILKKAAIYLIEDRKAARKPPLPGQAEYLDLLRAVEELKGSNGLTPDKLLDMVRPYLLQKSKSI